MVDANNRKHKCCAMVKPVDGICFYTEESCDVTRSQLAQDDDYCLNWADREYFDPNVDYPLGTLKIGEEREMLTNRGWRKLMDCIPDFATWGVVLGQYANRIIYIEAEECGLLERFDSQISSIKTKAKLHYRKG